MTDLITYLSEFATAERFEQLLRVVKNRTDYVTVVLEDIFQSQNASAVLRTCDCLGIQNIHIIENINKYVINPDVTLGSDKWLTVSRHNMTQQNTISAISSLKKLGYRIVATTPHTNDVTLEEFDVTKGKFAIMFGSEVRGLSQEALSEADEFIRIPMYGFTESFNISVSAAISLYHVISKLNCTQIDWKFSTGRQDEMLLHWLNLSIKDARNITKRFNQIQASKCKS